MKTMNCPVTKFIDSKMQRFDPLWQAQNGVGGLRSRYYDKTGVAKYREWRGLHDTMVDYRAWLKNVMSMAAMVASAPIPCLKGFWEYRWMGSYLGTFMFIDRLFEGYRGPELVIAHMNMHAIVQSLTKKIALVLSHDLRIGGKDSDKIIPVDEVMPPLFLTGFKDLIPIPLQTLPEFIICDEPVSALDVSIQAQILNLLMDLQDEKKLTYVFITHDLSVVKHISHEIMVMYLGQCVEYAKTEDLFKNPLHPYTKGLLDAVPIPSLKAKKLSTEVMRGELTSPVDPAPGCRFAARCPYATDACRGRDIPLKEVEPGHFVSCTRF